jgi:hypothetical protein
MATIKVHGEGNNEATIVELDSGWSFECSKGMWCISQDEIWIERSMVDAIRVASVHVERHDAEDLTRINS